MVSGIASIKMRRVGIAGGSVDEYIVSGAAPVVVEMPPGHTHSITNLSETDDLVTVIWANEPFDNTRSSVFYEEV